MLIKELNILDIFSLNNEKYQILNNDTGSWYIGNKAVAQVKRLSDNEIGYFTLTTNVIKENRRM